MAAHGDPLGAKKRLDSWKEIATFFGRDERTVKRWEKERGLPVYRVPGSARGGVFAYAEELAEWLKAPNLSWESGDSVPADALSADQTSAHQTSDRDRRPPVPALVPAAAVPTKVLTIKPAADVPVPSLKLVPAPSRLDRARVFLWLLPFAAIAASFVALSFTPHNPRLKHALAAPHIPAADAQDLYLKGRYYFEKRTPEDLTKSIDFFTQAIVHDPGYAAPYVGLADTYNLLREYSAMPPQEAFPRALAAATKAVELDPNNAEAHNSLAFASFWGFFDATTADREFKRAIELDPTLSRAHHWYATFLSAIQRDHDALAEIELARQLNPSSTPILADKGCILAAAGKTEEARTLLMQLTASQPDFAPSHRYLADYVYFPEGNYAGYFEEWTTVARLRHDGNAQKKIEAEQKAYARGGPRGLLEQQLASARESFEHGGSAFSLARAHAALAQNADALKYLEIAYQRHDLQLTTLTSDSALRPLHQNPQFKNLVAKVGLPPAQ
jgi:tetratricopeptide (TPR) repeat protein